MSEIQKYYCAKCGNEVKESELNCSKCKSVLALDGAITTENLKSGKAEKIEGEESESTVPKTNDFFDFRQLITPALIKFCYVIGIIGITLGGIFAMVGGGGAEIIMGCAIIIFGNIIWRLICEGTIIIFSIHELLVEISHKFKK